MKPEGETDLPLWRCADVKRELNWVRVAQRFPVRIEVENPDQNLFRMGASAVAIIKGPPPESNFMSATFLEARPRLIRIGSAG